MNPGNASSEDSAPRDAPSEQAQGIESAVDAQDEIVDSYDPMGGADEGDDFEEFGKYGMLAAQARVKGVGKGHGVAKMKQFGDTAGARKLHKPEHKPKRDI